MSQELQQKQSTNITQIDADSFIGKALESGAPVETLERLLAMRNEIQAENAKRAYYESLAAFQAECPPIKKGRDVKAKNGSVMYRYASLDDIVAQVSGLLQKHGFSYTIETKQEGGFITATTIVHHIGGHSSQSSFPVPVDVDGYMNSAQKAGSAQTYAKRYSFTNAFGLMTTDQDDDAQSLGKGIDINELHRKYANLRDAIFEHYASIVDIKNNISEYDLTGEQSYLSAAAESLDEIPCQDRFKLSVAWTKGGVFTPKEGKIIASNEFKVLCRTYCSPDGETKEKGPEFKENETENVSNG